MVFYIHPDFSVSGHSIAYQNYRGRIADGLIGEFYNDLICRYVALIDIIVRSILLLHFTVHDDFDILTVDKRICCHPAAAFNMEFASPVVICQCSPEGRLRATVQPFIAVFYNRLQTALSIRERIVEPFSVYTEHIVTINHSQFPIICINHNNTSLPA